mgnify:CR=1 FL=1
MTKSVFVESNDTVLLTCDAGVVWDELVTNVANRGLWGLENLAGIPGTVGAAAVQNIGAYGAVLSESVVAVRAYDTQQKQHVPFSREECTFGYRNSVFKRRPELIITEVSLRLQRNAVANTSYKDLLALVEKGLFLSDPSAVASAVRSVRAQKFPNIAEHGTAGSFFLNPVLGAQEATDMAERFQGMPLFPMPEGGVKVPVAWILDHRHGVVDLRNVRIGGAYVWPKHALVIATDRGAQAADVDMLATKIAQMVFNKTKIVLTREVRTLAY